MKCDLSLLKFYEEKHACFIAMNESNQLIVNTKCLLVK
jgi:hypothetical protein